MKFNPFSLGTWRESTVLTQSYRPLWCSLVPRPSQPSVCRLQYWSRGSLVKQIVCNGLYRRRKSLWPCSGLLHGKIRYEHSSILWVGHELICLCGQNCLYAFQPNCSHSPEWSTRLINTLQSIHLPDLPHACMCRGKASKLDLSSKVSSLCSWYFLGTPTCVYVSDQGLSPVVMWVGRYLAT